MAKGRRRERGRSCCWLMEKESRLKEKAGWERKAVRGGV